MEIYSTKPRRIGKHEWRCVVYEERGARMLRYEWRPADPAFTRAGFPVGYWWLDTDWPRYDHNNGMTAGLPKSILKLYEANRPAIREALGKGD